MVRINPEKCRACGVCLDYCPLEAISLVPSGPAADVFSETTVVREPSGGSPGKEFREVTAGEQGGVVLFLTAGPLPDTSRQLRSRVAYIDPSLCVQCWVCLRQRVCSFGAIEATFPEDFYHLFQHVISDPVETTAETGVPGRGTEEAKTNDVSGRYRRGEVGVAIDMGRPGLGCRLRDVEKVAMAVAAAGLVLEGPEHTPLAKLMADLKTGRIQEASRDLRVLSVIIEGKCSEGKLPAVLTALRRVETEIETVFTLGLVSRVEADGTAPLLAILERLGFPRPLRGKVNVGLGRPPAAET
ncbi:MAG: 4Fe-4S binding protein [Firmicutes bacterium]|nr:4Fe-4S binding protein [Bacillota bacterium]MCL5038485.1 4Fe-4S binding protein [Bacillota bacterium]